MEWHAIRHELVVSCCPMNLDKNKTELKEWQNIRKRVISKYKSSCMYCGGVYDKYLMCIHIDGDKTNNKLDNLELCCKICYAYTHLNMGFHDYFSVYKSNKSQLDIHKATLEYYSINGSVPTPKEIDKDCKQVNISMFEYINWLIKHKDSKYKLMLNKDFDINYFGIQHCSFESDISCHKDQSSHCELVEFEYLLE